ncbi:MAG: hypothetical protein ACK5KU_00535 [Beutenbergiaceae bacterium]
MSTDIPSGQRPADGGGEPEATTPDPALEGVTEASSPVSGQPLAASADGGQQDTPIAPDGGSTNPPESAPFEPAAPEPLPAAPQAPEISTGSDAGNAGVPVPSVDDDERVRAERARRFSPPQAAASQPAPIDATASVPQPSTPAVGSDGPGPTAAAPMTATQAMPADNSPSQGEDPFKDFDEGPTSRAAAHWWSILIAVLFVPVAWYLVADGGERTSFSLTNGGELNIAGPIELAAGALCLFFVLLAARWSSVGVILTGLVGLALGVGFIAAQQRVLDLLLEYQSALLRLDQLGQNIMDHVIADGTTGRLAIYGFVLVMAGVISHGARRQGRREEKRRAALGL